MKNYIYSSAILLINCILFSSCLKKNLPSLPLWDGNQITNVYVETRYNSPTQTFNGAPVVQYQRLETTVSIDTLTNQIKLDIAVPQASNSFPEEIRNEVTQTKLWMYCDISTAATIEPVEESNKLGEMSDLTKPQVYKVVAANKDEKNWTITVNSFTK